MEQEFVLHGLATGEPVCLSFVLLDDRGEAVVRDNQFLSKGSADGTHTIRWRLMPGKYRFRARDKEKKGEVEVEIRGSAPDPAHVWMR